MEEDISFFENISFEYLKEMLSKPITKKTKF